MSINYQSVILKLNEQDRKYGFEYLTNGYEDAIDYAGINIFSTENICSEDYCDLTERQFIKYIIKLAKDQLKDFLASV